MSVFDSVSLALSVFISVVDRKVPSLLIRPQFTFSRPQFWKFALPMGLHRYT